MQVATWNINGIRTRLPRVLDWLRRAAPDVVCLQETKVPDALFPRAEIEAAGYRATFTGQKGYNGVAILSRTEPAEIRSELPGEPDDESRRLIAARIDGVQILNVYVPNGSNVDSDKFVFKLRWLQRLSAFLEESFRPGDDLLLCGDFNIAPEDRDVHNPERWRDQVLFHPDEHAALARLQDWGLVDALRLHHPEAGLHSWWDYRAGAFHRGWGLRIDLVLLSQSLARRCAGVEIHRDERKGEKPSDHVPVVATLA